jgi:hypothetical protein
MECLTLAVGIHSTSVGPGEFSWNLHPHGKFSVCSLYNAIIQSDIPVENNKKI